MKIENAREEKNALFICETGEWMMLHLSRAPHQLKSEIRETVFKGTFWSISCRWMHTFKSFT